MFEKPGLECSDTFMVVVEQEESETVAAQIKVIASNFFTNVMVFLCGAFNETHSDTVSLC